MLSIQIGPVALPTAPLWLFGSVALASWLAERRLRHDPPQRDRAGRAVFHAALLGLLAARLAFVALNASAYAAAPLSVLDVRDGGWSAPAGLLAGAVWLVAVAWRHPGLRQALGLGGGCGLVLWLAGSLWLAQAGPDRLPAVDLVALDDGRPARLTEAAAGRPVVVNLWASWCGPCRIEMPVLAAAQQREAGVGFLFVNQGETATTVQTFLRQQGLPLREVWLDPASTLGRAVAANGLPVTLFFDAQGRPVDAHFGILNAAALQARLEALRTPAQLPR